MSNAVMYYDAFSCVHVEAGTCAPRISTSEVVGQDKTVSPFKLKISDIDGVDIKVHSL
ncbi:hypothetical protein BABINDRAFT_160346 [Babjeviella inositovora NRRL Y-12698]|uniref:Uncharacterized protein n=1 Tax=Babjeviella inositovora NRRL Y-12698 TaxID=984486 RepID=A0A1E3QTC1_9ASCO|nr:uncharacterized protein BABINDRAFT_160346 [Babjeviella inositovora NRRL Y-12698]ODQ80898.1 hypothetical protein BABINDRAFT_160346 [Babjeviella inositovora NRRL Y-12698]